MKHYKDKVIVTSYLEGVQGDLELRLEVFNGKFVMNETKDVRKQTIEKHIRAINASKNFLHELWDDYSKLLQEDIKRRTI
ncbi:MAG: hypothetical protein COA65_08575 [Rhodospirillaceae bacterium]|nr:MAG: hypothetical protein COA65_08575 [Rhodospirillaceae bacterium]